MWDDRGVKKPQPLDAEYEVVEGRGRIRWGSLAYHSALVGGLAWVAYDQPELGWLMVLLGAVQWPISRVFALMLRPPLEPQEVRPLERRMKSGLAGRLSRRVGLAAASAVAPSRRDR